MNPLDEATLDSLPFGVKVERISSTIDEIVGGYRKKRVVYHYKAMYKNTVANGCDEVEAKLNLAKKLGNTKKFDRDMA